jgi:ubiquinone/menaquinone biosynthesis C-methylase UbiE
MYVRFNDYGRLNNNKEIDDYKEFYKTISNKIEFGGDFTHYDYLAKNRFMDTLSPVMNTVLRKHPKNILDIGCGNGINLPLSKILPYIEYHGIDYADKTIETAKTVFPNVKFYIGDAFHLPFIQNSFDIAILSNVLILYNADDRVKLLSEICRILQKNGILILIVMNETKSLKIAIWISYILGRMLKDKLPKDFMCVHFSHKDIKRLAQILKSDIVQKFNTSHLYGILECIRFLNLSKFRRKFGKNESEFIGHPVNILKDLQEQAGKLNFLTYLLYKAGNIFPSLFSFYSIYVLQKR